MLKFIRGVMVFLLFISFTMLNNSCTIPKSTQQVTITPIEKDFIIDIYGCSKPTKLYIERSGFEFDLHDSDLLNVITFNIIGNVKFKIEPKIIPLLSRAAMDEFIRDYIRCLAKNRDRYTKEEIDHICARMDFMKTNPNPEQVKNFIKDNPFPKNIREFNY